MVPSVPSPLTPGSSLELVPGQEVVDTPVTGLGDGLSLYLPCDLFMPASLKVGSAQ